MEIQLFEQLESEQVLQSAIWTIGAGRHVSLPPPPIPLVYNTADLIGVENAHFVCNFVIDLAILQKYYVLTLES